MKELLDSLCRSWVVMGRVVLECLGVALAISSFVLFLIAPFTIVLRIAQGQLHWGWAGLCWLAIAAFAWHRGSK